MRRIKQIIFIPIFLSLLLFVSVYIYAFTPIFEMTPTATKNGTKLFLTESFEIDFPIAIDPTQYRNNIDIFPKTSIKILANGSGEKIIIKPLDVWLPNEKYTIHINQGRADNYRKVKEKTFHFTTIDYPYVVETLPRNDEKDVRLGIKDPIVIKFNKSTEKFYVDFILKPLVPLVYQNNKQKTEFYLLPKESLQSGVRYDLTIRIKAKDVDDRFYLPILSSSFVTLPPKPKTWSKNLHERIEQVRRFTTPQIVEGKYIDINLDAQAMIIFEDGKNLGTFLISSGKPGMDTPKGRHHIYNKYSRAWSDKYGLYMPYWMAITADGRFGIHELPEWPGGYKEGQNHLGIKVSHGCVRLGVGPAKRVYDWVDIGTPVIIY